MKLFVYVLIGLSCAAFAHCIEQKLFCIENPFQERKKSWRGNVEYNVEFVLPGPLKDWTVELHFNHPITRLRQWIGKQDTSLKVIHAQGKVYFLKSRSKGTKTLRGVMKMSFIASYAGEVEPKIQQVALCGYSNNDLVIPTQPKETTVLPTMATTGTIPKCTEITKKLWNNGVERVLKLPVIKKMSHWIIELRFDSTWTRFQQWNCHLILKGINTYTCQNKNYNGNQAAGDTLKFEYKLNFYGGKNSAPKLMEAWFGSYHCKN